METDSSEYEDQKLEIVKKSLPIIDMDQVSSIFKISNMILHLF
jgi:hypothetical protein